jgi:hypothetical protein
VATALSYCVSSLSPCGMRGQRVRVAEVGGWCHFVKNKEILELVSCSFGVPIVRVAGRKDGRTDDGSGMG